MKNKKLFVLALLLNVSGQFIFANPNKKILNEAHFDKKPIVLEFKMSDAIRLPGNIDSPWLDLDINKLESYRVISVTVLQQKDTKFSFTIKAAKTQHKINVDLNNPDDNSEILFITSNSLTLFLRTDKFSFYFIIPAKIIPEEKIIHIHKLYFNKTELGAIPYLDNNLDNNSEAGWGDPVVYITHKVQTQKKHFDSTTKKHFPKQISPVSDTTDYGFSASTPKY